MTRFIAKAFLAASLALASLSTPGVAQTQQTGPQHGLSLFGDLKYKPDFQHFDYANPDAPKGGTMKFSAIGTFTGPPGSCLSACEMIRQLWRISSIRTMNRAHESPSTAYGTSKSRSR